MNQRRQYFSVQVETSVPLQSDPLNFLELCGTVLLIKHCDSDLTAHDLITGKITPSGGSLDFHPYAVTFLPVRW